MLPVSFIGGRTVLAGRHSEPPKTGAKSGLFFSQAPATTCPFLCLLASTDTVSAASLLQPGRFLAAGLPWLVQLRALISAVPQDKAVTPGLARVPPPPGSVAAPDACRGGQGGISGRRRPAAACAPSREPWGRAAVCGRPSSAGEGRGARGVPLSHRVPWAPQGLAWLSHGCSPGAVPRFPLRPGWPAAPVSAFPRKPRVLAPRGGWHRDCGPRWAALGFQSHGKPAMAREGRGGRAPPWCLGPPLGPAGGVAGARPRPPV